MGFFKPEEEEEEDIYTLVNGGLALYGGGYPFEAHEIWEYAWKGEVGRSRLTLQVLILIAAAMFKVQSGNMAGPSKLLAKARDKLRDLLGGGSAWLGVDLVALLEDVLTALADADRRAKEGQGEVFVPTLPKVVGRDGILYLHGFASGPTSAKAQRIVPDLRAQNFFVAVPDLNEDDFTGLTVSRALALSKRHLRERTLVIGSSLGGYIAALLQSQDERVRALVLMAPAFAFVEGLRARHGEAALARWRGARTVEVEHYAYERTACIGYGLFEDALGHPRIPPIRVPTRILHGTRDDAVSPERSQEVAALYPGHVELLEVDGDHGLTRFTPQVREWTEDLVTQLGFQPDPSPQDPAEILSRFPGS